MTSNHLHTLKRKVFGRIALGILALGVLLFLPAGTIAFWEAWLYLAILYIPMFFALIYFIKNDPELLERRMRLKEKEIRQKLIVKFGWIYFILAFLIPGFDKRYGWSDIPVVAVIAADIIALLGYGIFILVLKENSYASRIIEVEPEQKVISTGPYAIVRHPMYVGVMLMYIFSPLALDSYWALLPSLMIIPLIVVRILNEEHVLEKDLAGYKEYRQKVRYRLIPGIW